MDMILTSDDGFLIIGSTSSFGFDNSQMYFLKLDSLGNIQWSKSHGGNGQEWGSAVIQTSDGGYLGVGYTNSWGNGGFDAFLVKLSNNGNLEYEAVKGGTDWDFAWDVIEPTPGKFVIAGETSSAGNGASDGWIFQFDDASRTFDWETTVGSKLIENLKAVTKGLNNDFFAVGLGHSVNREDDDIMLVHFSTNGDSLHSHFYGDTLLDYGNDLILMNDSSIAITGIHEKFGVNPGIAVLKVDTLGGIIFDTLWSGFQNSVGNSITEIDSSRIAIIGTVELYPGNTDIFAGYTFSGNYFPQVSQTLGSPEDEEEQGMALQFLGPDGFVLAGTTNGYDNYFKDVLVFNTNTLCVTANNNYKNNEDSGNILGVNAPIRNEGELYFDHTNRKIWLMNNKSIHHFELFDLMGRKIFSGNISDQYPVDLSTSNLPTGYYIITAFSESDTNSLKVLIFIP
jgi:hypothetical protein